MKREMGATLDPKTHKRTTFAWMPTSYPRCICIQVYMILQLIVAEIQTRTLNLTKVNEA